MSVVVPVHNERANLETLHPRLTSVLNASDVLSWEVVYVEDESTDGTKTYIDELARGNPSVQAIHLRRSWGQSTALNEGFQHATGDIIVAMDGDGQNDPRDIPRLIQKLHEQDADCVSGWRRDRHDPWHKTIPSRVQTILGKRLGPQIHDFGCTLKAYRREALESISLYGERHRYIPSQLHQHGYSVTELEVRHHPRRHGESRYGIGRLVRGFVDLVYTWFWMRYGTRPMHVFGGLGMVLITLGGLVGLASVVQRYAFNVPLGPRTPRLILIALTVMLGVQLVVFGVLAEMLTEVRENGTRRDRVEYTVP